MKSDVKMTPELESALRNLARLKYSSATNMYGVSTSAQNEKSDLDWWFSEIKNGKESTVGEYLDQYSEENLKNAKDQRWINLRTAILDVLKLIGYTPAQASKLRARWVGFQVKKLEMLFRKYEEKIQPTERRMLARKLKSLAASIETER